MATKWNRLLREVVESVYVEVLETWLDVVLGKVLQPALLVQWSWIRWLQGLPFQPQPLSDSLCVPLMSWYTHVLQLCSAEHSPKSWECWSFWSLNSFIVILSYVCVLKEWISLLLFDTGLAEIGVPFMCLLHHYNLHFCTIQPISIFCNISKTRSVAPNSHQFINNFLIVLKGVEKSLYLDSQKRFECTAICWKYRVSYRLVRTVHAVRHTRLV